MGRPTTVKKPEETKPNPWPFRLWLISIIGFVLVLSNIVTAWSVKHVLASGGARFTEAQSAIVLGISNFPNNTKQAMLQLISILNDEPTQLLIEKSEAEKPHWKRLFPSAEDDGYLLLSGVHRGDKQAAISLIRIRDGEVMARWRPDWDEVLRQTHKTKYSNVTRTNVLPVHPILLADGDVVFNTWETMARVGVCDSKPKWVLGEIMHHSNELDYNGNIWAPSLATDAFPDNPWLTEQIRDDALAEVSPDGKLLRKVSFAKILRDNGLEALMLGTKGLRLHDDPIHLNQITVADKTTDHWQRGDLLLSSRNMSTIFLYRPSTQKIIWYKTGPWMNQHSAAFVGDHQISVFDNNVYANDKPSNLRSFVAPDSINRVMVYDFKTAQVSEPYAELLAEAKPISVTQGRAQILEDGGLFIEETNFGRHLRFSKDKMLWSRINDYDDERIGRVAWSRYLTAEEVAEPLKAISNLNCNGKK
ncbi:MAG TPA: arylsulfotransferase family protein [Methylophilaceae bacterium]|nr:arylsulfotransferase family protein [Methylophilaceae bacterium]